jgi:hypothetical protein
VRSRQIGDASVAVGQMRQDPAAGRIRQSSEYLTIRLSIYQRPKKSANKILHEPDQPLLILQMKPDKPRNFRLRA